MTDLRTNLHLRQGRTVVKRGPIPGCITIGLPDIGLPLLALYFPDGTTAAQIDTIRDAMMAPLLVPETHVTESGAVPYRAALALADER